MTALATAAPVMAAGNEAFGGYVRLLAWSGYHETEGRIPATAALAFVGSPDTIAKLLACGLLAFASTNSADTNEGDYVIVGYERDQVTAQCRRAISRKRRRAGRLGGRASPKQTPSKVPSTCLASASDGTTTTVQGENPSSPPSHSLLSSETETSVPLSLRSGPKGRRVSGSNPRAVGTNPRATGTNPRALSPEFVAFWKRYPRRTGKGPKAKAAELWGRLSPADRDLASSDLLARVANHPDWQSPRDGGRYLPMVTTYLRGQLWTDDWGQEPLKSPEPAPEPDWACRECQRTYGAAEARALRYCPACHGGLMGPDPPA